MNKYKRAAEYLTQVPKHTKAAAQHYDVLIALGDLAAQLPEGEAERVLKEAAEQGAPIHYPGCVLPPDHDSDCRGGPWVLRPNGGKL